MDPSILMFFKTTENPFRWSAVKIPGIDPEADSDSETSPDNNEIDASYENAVAELKWHYAYIRYCMNMVFISLNALNGNLKKAREKLAECEEVMSLDDRVMVTYQPAFQHILYSTRLFIEFKSDNEEEALKLIEKIPCFDELEDTQKAAVWATKANFLIRRYSEGMFMAVPSAQNALELCSTESEWHLLMGNIMSRVRHTKHPSPPPTKTELSHYELGFSMDETPTIAALLAGAYADLSLHYSLQDSKDDIELANSYNRKAYDMYRKSIELNKDVHPEVMIRCARGLTRLTGHFDAWPLATELMYKALEKAPRNGMVNHYSGLICMKQKKFEEARQYLQVSLERGVLIAAFTLIHVLTILDPTFSGDEFFKALLDDFPSSSDQAKIFLNASVYHLFKEMKFISAVIPFTKVLQMDPTNEEIKKRRSTWGKIKQIDLIELFANDVQFELKSSNHCYSDKELDDMRVLLQLLEKVAPEKVSREVTRSMLAEILSGAASRNSTDRQPRGKRVDYRDRKSSSVSQETNCSVNWRSRESKNQTSLPTAGSGRIPIASSRVPYTSSAPTGIGSWRIEPHGLPPITKPKHNRLTSPNMEGDDIKYNNSTNNFRNADNTARNEKEPNFSKEISVLELHEAINK